MMPDLNENLHPGEGALFKIIELSGKTFEIRYGFYEERDRHTPYAEPVPIYPDFLKKPCYTDDGRPFVTAMQAPCPWFDGNKDADSGCGDCGFYRHGEELLGICSLQKAPAGDEKTQTEEGGDPL